MEKKKKLILIAIGLFIFVGFAILGVLGIMQKRQIERLKPTPFPTKIEERLIVTPGSKQDLFVTATLPADQEQNVPQDQRIIVTFNRVIKSNQIEIVIAPEVPLSLQFQGRRLVIDPKENFLPGTLYRYTIKYKKIVRLPQSYTFTTLGPKSKYLPDTQPSGALSQEQEFQKKNNPDVFLRNKTPFENENFKVASDYRAAEVGSKGHFYFIVTLKAPDREAARQAFLDWLAQLGLAAEKIAGLDIEYKF